MILILLNRDVYIVIRHSAGRESRRLFDVDMLSSVPMLDLFLHEMIRVSW